MHTLPHGYSERINWPKLKLGVHALSARLLCARFGVDVHRLPSGLVVCDAKFGACFVPGRLLCDHQRHKLPLVRRRHVQRRQRPRLIILRQLWCGLVRPDDQCRVRVRVLGMPSWHGFANRWREFVGDVRAVPCWRRIVSDGCDIVREVCRRFLHGLAGQPRVLVVHCRRLLHERVGPFHAVPARILQHCDGRNKSIDVSQLRGRLV